MSLQQQAYTMIDQLTEENVKDVIKVMAQMLLDSNHKTKTVTDKSEKELKRMQAYCRLKALRRHICAYVITDYDAEREHAMAEKYGAYMQA